ncbi:MAG: glycosyltransferase family 4 protein [Vicinamibacterales bacterium]
MGPSAAKFPLDALLTLTAFRVALTGKYDAIHSHEEGGVIGVVLSTLLRIPHLYDMHSSLPQQLTNFAFTGSSVARGIVRWFEKLMINRSKVVIVICPALEDTVRETAPTANVVLIENAPGSAEEKATSAQAAEIRTRHGLSAEAPLVLYTGTFEAYQGLDLLFDSMAHVRKSRPDARLLLAGGKPDQVEKARAQAAAAGIADVTIFAGERPATEIPAYLLACDVLVSPRSRGTNTPLKIYQYLRSGKAIVATRLMTHTQVLDDETSILTGVSAEEFGNGILRALADRATAATLGANAQRLAETKYSYEAYLEKTERACAALFSSATPLSPGSPVKDVA